MSDLLREVMQDIGSRPFAYLAELAQCAILVLIVRAVLIRTVGKPLGERRQRLAEQVAHAKAAAARHEEAVQRAAAIVAEARAAAQRTTAAATDAAERARTTGYEQIARDAAAAVHQAEQAVEAEKLRVSREASERLVDLIGVAVRRFLEQAVSDDQRRALTNQLILDRIEGLAR